MGAIEDLAARYSADEEPSQGSAIEALASLYTDDDDTLSVEEQRARLYANAMSADRLALGDSGVLSDTLSGTGADALRAAGMFGSGVVSGLAGAQEFVGDVAQRYALSENMRRAGEFASDLMADELAKQEIYRDEFLGMADPTLSEGRKKGISLASNLPQLGLFAVNPAVGLGVAGAQAFGEEAAGAKRAGAGLGERALSGAVTAGAEVVAEKVLGDARLLKSIREAAALPIKSAKQAIRNILVNSGMEGTDEVVSQVLSRVGQEATYLDSYSGTEEEKKAQREADLRQTGEAFVGGAFIGATATGASLPIGRGRPSVEAQPPPPSSGPPPTPVESALAEVEALWSSAQMAARERELAELPIEAFLSETEQQIEALRQLENQAAAAAAAAQAQAFEGYQRQGISEEAAITAEEFAKKPEERDLLELDVRIEPDAEARIESAAAATSFPKPAGPTEEVLDETADIARAIDHAAASKEAVAISQSPDSAFEAIMLGDPSRLGSPEYFAAQRAQLEERLASIRSQYEQMKAGVKDAGDGAAKAVMTDAEAREALKTIRRGALEQALRIGDPDLFDRLDIETRRRLILFPEDMDKTISIRNERARSEIGAATLPETMSELRDVTIAALPVVEAKANKDFDILSKAGNVPLNEAGAPKSREEFVREEVLGFQSGLTERFRSLMFEAKPDGSNSTEIMRKARSVINKTLKSKGLSREQIGFRGDAALDRQGVVDEGAEWLSARMAGRKIHDFTESELVDLARNARVEGAPVSTYEFIRSELRRRADNIPPVQYNPAKVDPAEATRIIRDGVTNELEPAIRAALGADPAIYVPGVGGTWLERNLYWWRRFVGRAGGMLRANTSLGPVNFGPKESLSTHFWQADLADPVSALKDSRIRNASIKMSSEARSAAAAERSVLHHKIASWASETNRAIKAYVSAQRANGVSLSTADVEQQIYEAVTERRTASLPPELQQIVKDSEPIRTEWKGYSVQLAKGDPAKLAEIERLGDAYLFRSYAIHKDPDAFVKRLDRTSEPYRAFYRRIQEEGYSALYEEAYRDAAPKLRELGMSEPEIQVAVEKVVMAEMIPGLIESIAKKSLGSRDTEPAVAARIGKATKETLIERVMDDPNLRAMLGEEKIFTLAMVQGMEKVALDMSRLRLTSDLLKVWRNAGVAGDRKSGIRTVQISKQTLDKIEVDEAPGETLWVTPDVYNTLNGIKAASDGFDQLASEAIALVKMGYVANTGTALVNWHGLPFTALLAGGVNAPFALAARKGELIRYAQLTARELQFPGGGKRALSKRKVSSFYEGLGMTPEKLVGAVQELQELGLDAGGEMAFEMEKAKNALMEGASAVLPTTLRERVRGVANFLMELYRHPDVMMKVMAFQFNLDELSAKEGVEVPSKELRREAARRALTLTQDPRSTPELIRATNKGKIGTLMFNFASFQYQMMRNLYYGSRYAYEDASASVKYARDAQRLDAAGNALAAAKAREKASIYGKYALNRAAGVATAGLFAGDLLRRALIYGWELLGGEDESEKERHLKAILPFPEDRQSKMAPIATWRENGKTFATIVKTGKSDPYDGALSVLRALGENPQGEKSLPGDPAEAGRRVMAAMSLLRDQFIGLSAFGDALTDFARIAGQENATAGDWGRAVLKAGKRLAPRGASTPVQTVAAGIRAHEAGALEFSREFPYFEGDPTNADYEKFRRGITRLATGVGVQTIPVDDYWSSRTHDVWGEASWRRAAREEWKNAATPSARLKVKAKYADSWESLQNALWNMSEHGLGADLSQEAMKKALSDPEVTKYKGDKIPKWMHQKVVYRIPVTLDSYLNESVKP